MGITIAGSGTISSSTGSISFDDDNITTTGTIPASQLTGQVPTANLNNAPDLSSDIRALALQTAADRISLENGIADPFVDNSDVSIDEFVGNFGGNATAGNTHSSDSSFAAQRFSVGATGGTVTQVKFTVQGVAFASGTDIRIETDDGTTTPSGTLVDSNAVLTTSAHSISTNLVTENFPGSFSLAANTSYWIVISRNSAGGYGVYRNTSNGATMGGTGAFINSFNANYELGIYVPINVVGDSTNAAHNSSGTFYAPTTLVSGSPQDLSSKSYFGNMTSNGGVAASFNGTTSQNYQSSSSTTSQPATVGVALGSGYGFPLTQAKVYAPNNTGYNAPNGIKIYGNSSASTTGGTLLFTATAGTDYSNGPSSDVSTFAVNSSTSYENYYAELLFSSGAAYLAELELFSGTLQNMTILSNSFTATSAPSSTVIGLQTVESAYCTPNTDFTAEVSRDGGTTFTACTLALKSTLGASNTKYYESAATDISSQPSGTSMKYRIKTLNNKNIQVHGVALKWS